ncbi:MAG: glycoside hydrolase family 127 protein [Bacteroidetes bacterium]|nr:glycoside hydrolase family 127 protein [Bacteroidota bacterium]
MKKVKVLLFGVSLVCYSQQVLPDYPISFVSLRNVTLTDSFWLPKMKLIQSVTIPHCIAKCNEEGRIDNFLIAAGIKKGSVRGKMPFDDTDVYKVIEGASYSLMLFPNPSLEAMIDSLITTIALAQEPDGYLTTWMTIDPQNPPAWWAKKVGERWLGEEANHELYNAGHLYEAAVAHYIATGKRTLLNVAIKNADLLLRTFGYGKLTLPPGHQIVETGLVKLARVTGNVEYARLAKFFLDIRGDSTTHKLYGPYSQDHVPVLQQNEIVGHAVRAVYMYTGMTDIAQLYDNVEYLRAVQRVWHNMVEKKMYITGGIGSRHDGESFGEEYELPNSTAYCETCASIGTVLWNARLFQLTGNAIYFTVIERVLYNSLLSGLSKDGKRFFYVNPLEYNGTTPFNVGFQTRQEWFECACCPTNVVRFFPSIPSYIYSTSGDTVYINLYVASNATLTLRSNTVHLVQQGEYPWNGKVKIRVQTEKPKPFTLKVRIPGWVQNSVLPGTLYSYLDSSSTMVRIVLNGKKIPIIYDRGYITITRQWNTNDRLVLDYPMKVRRVVAHENVLENRNRVVIEYGPFIYCAEGIDNNYPLDSIVVNNTVSLRAEYRRTDLGDMVVVSGNVSDLSHLQTVPFTAIPYFCWANRGNTLMKVWFLRR